TPTHSWKQKNWFLIAILAYVLGLITPDIQRLIAPGSLQSPASSATVIVDTVRR
ncbi:MAG: hypothetical protein JWQ78_1889, partial [Sediminibacterium sp.]|nr:hypothetical protein [Sediminibacterium sp.]